MITSSIIMVEVNKYNFKRVGRGEAVNCFNQMFKPSACADIAMFEFKNRDEFICWEFVAYCFFITAIN
ncbi:hypothetical protein D3C87_1576710 [compost metagenome]